jgi:purine nucleosidase
MNSTRLSMSIATLLVAMMSSAFADEHNVPVPLIFDTDLANLLDSTPDDVSPFSGKELVSKKVRLLSIMAGAFKQIVDNNGQLHDHLEYNIVKDIPSAKVLCKDWPTPIVWSGFEIGKNLTYPHESILQDYKYVEHHPLAEAYTLYNPPPHNRPTWDLTSVLHAIRPNRSYFDVSPRGRVSIADDGLTTFEEDSSGRDRYLIIRDEQKGRTTEALVQLSSQPPMSK